MRILRPSRRSAAVRHVSALSAPSVAGAASSKLMPAGMCAIRALSRMHMNSACAPNLRPLLPKTRSPTANSLTPAPAASTSPANSLPRIRCLGRRTPETRRLRSETPRPLLRLASRVWTSNRLTVEAFTLMSTSSSLGTGGSRSSSLRTSGGPYLSHTTALIVAPDPPGRRRSAKPGVRIAEPAPAEAGRSLAHPDSRDAPVAGGGAEHFEAVTCAKPLGVVRDHCQALFEGQRRASCRKDLGQRIVGTDIQRFLAGVDVCDQVCRQVRHAQISGGLESEAFVDCHRRKARLVIERGQLDQLCDGDQSPCHDQDCRRLRDSRLKRGDDPAERLICEAG